MPKLLSQWSYDPGADEGRSHVSELYEALMAIGSDVKYLRSDNGDKALIITCKQLLAALTALPLALSSAAAWALNTETRTSAAAFLNLQPETVASTAIEGLANAVAQTGWVLDFVIVPPGSPIPDSDLQAGLAVVADAAVEISGTASTLYRRIPPTT